MDKSNYTTEAKKNQHLTDEERHEIEVRYNKDHWGIYKIAQHLGRAYNTIKAEIARGTVADKKGKHVRYRSDRGKEVYQIHRQSCRRKYRCMKTSRFLRFVVRMFRQKGWSLDACVGYALTSGKFRRDEIVCTKTLYNYVALGLLSIRNIDLPEKLSRNTKGAKDRENKRNLGTSIEERPEIVESRTEFGHWEIDSVLGKKGEDEPIVMTLTERMTRYSLWIKARNHTAEAIQEALESVLAHFGERVGQVFKTITADNGSEFAQLHTLETGETKVYFTHPYSSWEKGTNECHNRMLRRFLPKSRSITGYSAEDILFFGDMINGLPRKILRYRTPEQLFEQHLDFVYAI